jgi:D-psicose/D-tagatose/L-ribulose 3-epimerase
MNKFGVHAMIFIDAWGREQAERATRAAAKLGYDVIEIPLFDPAAVDLAHTRDLLRELKLTPAVSLGLTAEEDISSSDLAVSKAGVRRLKAVVDATAFIGGSTVCGVIASAWQKYAVAPTEAGRANAAAGLREVAQDARGKGVTLALEVVNRFESNLLNTCAQALQMVDRIGEPNVKVHLDTFHMHIEEPDSAAAIALCGDRLGYFHINESHRGYLDTGSIPLQLFFRALTNAGYEGIISFEGFSSSTCSTMVAGKAAVWRAVYEDSDDVAGNALAIMRSARNAAERTERLVRGGV